MRRGRVGRTPGVLEEPLGDFISLLNQELRPELLDDVFTVGRLEDGGKVLEDSLGRDGPSVSGCQWMEEMHWMRRKYLQQRVLLALRG